MPTYVSTAVLWLFDHLGVFTLLLPFVFGAAVLGVLGLMGRLKREEVYA